MPLPKLKLWLAIAIVFYSVSHLLWYLGTPLGQSPVLDGQENLALARQIADGTLPQEPFYRAMLYPALLAALPIGYAGLGLLAHFANAILVYLIARRFWASESGALVSAALVGLNPVLLHFAFDPLDITLAITFFLGSLAALQKAYSLSKSGGSSALHCALAGSLLALACLARPHFLAVLAPLLFAAIALTLFRRAALRSGLSFIIAAALPLLAYGLVQKSHSGSFGIMPWQGAYNLWISNNPNANGLYFAQSVNFHYIGEHQNATRLESEQLYQENTGEPGTIDERNRYWRGKTVDHVLANPIDWIQLELYKLYALLNNFEQYNNKTYSFHKSLSPWLRYNPISWGILFVLATGVCTVLWRQKRLEITATLLIGGAFAGGVLIYMASGRFRLPLVPLLAVLAGGLPFALKALKASSAPLKRRTAIATGLAAVLAFSFFGGIDSKATYVQDAMLLADASAKLGDDHLAIHWAGEALALAPERQDAKRLRLISQYNLVASGQIAPDPAFWNGLASELDSLTLADQRLSFIRGVILWNTGRRPEAQSVWKSEYSQSGLEASAALAALVLTRAVEPAPLFSAELQSEIATGRHPLLAFALTSSLPSHQRADFLQSLAMPPERYMAIGKSLELILPLD